MKIRVLQLNSYKFTDNMSEELRNKYEEELRLDYKRVPTRFNRDGLYYDGLRCWIEANGKAYEYEKDQFLYELKLLESAEYDKKVIDALRNLYNLCPSLLSTKQKELLDTRLMYESGKRLSRDMKLRIMRYLRKNKK